MSSRQEASVTAVACAVTVIRPRAGAAVVCTCAVAVVLEPCACIAVCAVDVRASVAVCALDVSAVTVTAVAVITVSVLVSGIPSLTVIAAHVRSARALTRLSIFVNPVQRRGISRRLPHLRTKGGH